MTEPKHYVSGSIDLEMAVALGIPVVANCGTRFIPRPSEVAEALPSCPVCDPDPYGGKRGQPRNPIEVRRAFPHYVYRCYDAQDRLLYVGCSYNPVARLRQHKSERKSWVSRVARTRMTVWPDRRKALDMERLAIETEHPLHNRQFSKRAAS